LYRSRTDVAREGGTLRVDARLPVRLPCLQAVRACRDLPNLAGKRLTRPSTSAALPVASPRSTPSEIALPSSPLRSTVPVCSLPVINKAVSPFVVSLPTSPKRLPRPSAPCGQA